MQNWIKENSVSITIVISTVVALATVLTVTLTSINSIHHRLDDMNQRLNDIRAEMNQRFDAQDKYINQRFDAQDKYINQRFDAQDRHINQRFDAVDRRFDALENDVSELHELLVSTGERVSRNEGQIDVIRQQLQTADAPAPPD